MQSIGELGDIAEDSATDRIIFIQSKTCVVYQRLSLSSISSRCAYCCGNSGSHKENIYDELTRTA